jgi:general stress protein 26
MNDKRTPAPKEVGRRSVRLSEEEAWAFVDAAHTGIFCSVKRDGYPVSLPVWFVTRERQIYLSTPASAKKALRVRNNPATSFLVESGEYWRELSAVHLSCSAEVIDDGEVVTWVDEQKSEKYRQFRTAHTAMSTGTRGYYEGQRVAIRLIPNGKILSWDNSRLETKPEAD